MFNSLQAQVESLKKGFSNDNRVSNIDSSVEKSKVNNTSTIQIDQSLDEQAGRVEAFERLKNIISDQLKTISRHQEELQEQQIMHEMTVKQLESATQLAKDAQNGEADAERHILALKLEIDQLKKKIQNQSSLDLSHTLKKKNSSIFKNIRRIGRSRMSPKISSLNVSDSVFNDSTGQIYKSTQNSNISINFNEKNPKFMNGELFNDENSLSFANQNEIISPISSTTLLNSSSFKNRNSVLKKVMYKLWH